MTKTEVMKQLKAAGTAQNRKIFRRHGGQGEMYGVSFAVQRKLQRKIKVDHALAEALWATENLDARALATLIADPDALTWQGVNAWVKDLDCYGMTDLFSDMVSKSPLAKRCMKKWTSAKSEWVGQSGWWLLSSLGIARHCTQSRRREFQPALSRLGPRPAGAPDLIELLLRSSQLRP